MGASLRVRIEGGNVIGGNVIGKRKVKSFPTISGVTLNMLIFGETLKTIYLKEKCNFCKKVPLFLIGSLYGDTSTNTW